MHGWVVAGMLCTVIRCRLCLLQPSVPDSDSSLAAPQVVAHMKSRTDYNEAEGFNAEERQHMDTLTRLALYAWYQMDDIRSPVTALYACAEGRYWHAALVPAMMDKLVHNRCAMLKELTDITAYSFGNLAYVLKKAAEVADGGRGDAVADDLALQAVQEGGFMHTTGGTIVADFQQSQTDPT